jgi:hypothetical protein
MTDMEVIDDIQQEKIESFLQHQDTSGIVQKILITILYIFGEGMNGNDLKENEERIRILKEKRYILFGDTLDYLLKKKIQEIVIKLLSIY